jgi:hypothetical protein
MGEIGMADGKQWRPQLHIPALPKAEWFLMNQMCTRYNLVDDKGKPLISELFAVLLALGYEVCHWNDGQGEQWFVRLVQEQLDRKEGQSREYGW